MLVKNRNVQSWYVEIAAFPTLSSLPYQLVRSFVVLFTFICNLQGCLFLSKKCPSLYNDLPCSRPGVDKI